MQISSSSSCWKLSRKISGIVWWSLRSYWRCWWFIIPIAAAAAADAAVMRCLLSIQRQHFSTGTLASPVHSFKVLRVSPNVVSKLMSSKRKDKAQLKELAGVSKGKQKGEHNTQRPGHRQSSGQQQCGTSHQQHQHTHCALCAPVQSANRA